jgi:hypothetical protein
MGTRGIWGFYKDGVTKATYNHYDSYPTGLGKEIQSFVCHTREELDSIFERIEMVKSDDMATPEQIEECAQWLDSSVSGQTASEWYCLLRQSQGKPEAYMKGLKYMIDNQSFLTDSLFCEWGYIINLDTGMVEVYRGFQKTKQDTRYPVEKPDGQGYWNCKLERSMNIRAFIDLDLEEFEQEIYKSEED